MHTFDTDNKPDKLTTSYTNFFQNISKKSYKDYHNFLDNSSALSLLYSIRDILDSKEKDNAKEEKIKALVSSSAYTPSQCVGVFQTLRNSPQFRNHRPLIDSLEKDLWKGKLGKKETNDNDPNRPVAFSFEDDTTDEENTFRLPDREIRSQSGEHLSLLRSSQTYFEDVDKPPILETHLEVNKFAKLTTYQHAFLGLRYTQYDKVNQKYVRKFFRISFSGLDGKVFLGLFNKKLPAKITDDTNRLSSVSTQTPITAKQTQHLFDNIYFYFQKYRYYQFYTRNCNTFIKEMAESIGVNNISSLHDHTAPSLVADNVSKLVSSPDGSIETFANYDYEELMLKERYNEYNTFFNKYYREYGFESNHLLSIKRFNNQQEIFDYFSKVSTDFHDIRDANFKINLLVNSDDLSNFRNIATREARKDLGPIDKLRGRTFKNPTIQANINTIADNMIELIGPLSGIASTLQLKQSKLQSQNTEGYMDTIKQLNHQELQAKESINRIKQCIKETIMISGKSHIYLNVYLTRMIDMLQKLLFHMTGRFEKSTGDKLQQERAFEHDAYMKQLMEQAANGSTEQKIRVVQQNNNQAAHFDLVNNLFKKCDEPKFAQKLMFEEEAKKRQLMAQQNNNQATDPQT